MGWIIGVLAVPLLVIVAYALRQGRISLRLLCEIQSLEEYIAAARKSLSRRGRRKASIVGGRAADVQPQPGRGPAKQLMQMADILPASVPEPIGPAQARTASRS